MEDLTQSQETTDKFVMPEREELHIFGDEYPEKSREVYLKNIPPTTIGPAMFDSRRILLADFE